MRHMSMIPAFALALMVPAFAAENIFQPLESPVALIPVVRDEFRVRDIRFKRSGV